MLDDQSGQIPGDDVAPLVVASRLVAGSTEPAVAMARRTAAAQDAR